jgi:protein-L-isoaspartate(D-aspartate) O-methyltransferase
MSTINFRTILIMALLSSSSAIAANDEYAVAREGMVREIQTMARQINDARLRISPGVFTAISEVPRHRFVPTSFRKQAYDNKPLPIGQEQTISQPYIVALMTELVGAHEGSRILEVGTGSGYQAAVLAELGAKVYTIEIVSELGKTAAALLQELGYRNVETRIGDGYAGWAQEAPFDGILVTAAPDHVPQPLVDQLKPGGRIIIPLGRGSQQLAVITKNADGTVQREDLLLVAFVPLTR